MDLQLTGKRVAINGTAIACAGGAQGAIHD
jgi:hypothetical protein